MWYSKLDKQAGQNRWVKLQTGKSLKDLKKKKLIDFAQKMWSEGLVLGRDTAGQEMSSETLAIES